MEEYVFASFPLDEVGIGRETYRPSQNGYDFGITSASDTIRTIWAYLIGILDSRSMLTDHLGLLDFDEPKQQSTADLSFQALAEAGFDIRWASRSYSRRAKRRRLCGKCSRESNVIIRDSKARCLPRLRARTCRFEAKVA